MTTPPPTIRHEQLESFLTRIEPFLDIWPQIDLRYSTVLQGGDWRNLFTRVSFSWDRTPPASMGVLALGEKFRAGRLTLPREDGVAWLKNLGRGRMPLENIEVRLDWVMTGSGGEPTSSYGWTELQSNHSGGLANLKLLERTSLHAYVLQGNGGLPWELQTAEEWLRLEDSLLRLEHPFGGLGEFSTAYLGFSEAKTLGHSTSFDIVAPFDTAFLGWSIKEGRAFTGLISHPPTVAAGDLSIAAILSTADLVDRMQCKVAVESGTAPDQLVTSKFGFPWKDYRTINLRLLLRGIAVDSLPLVFPAPGSANPRFQSLFGLHRIGELLSETLAQPKSVRESHRLEILVCWILHLCGFQTAPTGLPDMDGGDVADIIAFDPYANEAFVVEVTARDPLSNEKLSRLRRRADTVAASVPTLTFYPVAVAVARDSFLDTEMEAAKALSIILLGRADLQRLFELAQANELPGNILRRLISGRS
ncbi:MAG: hypothetical protein WBG19_02950 [Thermoplasmata archaeon]